MANVGNYELFIGIKKLMVFEIGGNEHICPCLYCFRKQETTRASTNGYGTNGLFQQFCMTQRPTNQLTESSNSYKLTSLLN